MAEEQQVTKEPQQVQHEPQQVTTKNPKKVEAGKRLAAHSHRQREKKREEAQVKSRGVSQYYGIHAFGAGAVPAVGVIGGLAYYIYQSKKGGPEALWPRYSKGPTTTSIDVPMPQCLKNVF